MNSKIIFDMDLVEINFGDWEMLTWNEISAKFPEMAAFWIKNGFDFNFPNGEKNSDFVIRIKKAALKISVMASESGNRNIAVVAHGGVIKMLICLWLGLSPEKHVHFSVSPASVSAVSLSTEDFGFLHFLNDTSHFMAS